MRRLIFGTVIGRLATASLLIAAMAGGVWAWTTSPWYLLPDQYFITVSPDGSALQRNCRPFDIRSEYHRSLLVSGPVPKPFGVDPGTNVRKLEREMNFGAAFQAADARLYSEWCGFMDEKVQKQRAWWNGATLCNSADLSGEVLQAAIETFHRKVDDEISEYRSGLGINAARKLGMSLLVSLIVSAVAGGGMWIARGELV